MEKISPKLEKTPTNLNSDPIEPRCQLGLTLYRLGHGSSYTTIEDLFGVSITLAANTFTKVIRVLIQEMYDDYVRMPQTDEEWVEELKGFIENYEFPCIGAWDGFHVYVGSKLKSYFSFKKRYSMSSLGLVGHNKRFLSRQSVPPVARTTVAYCVHRGFTRIL